jgi:hypothetical protein
MVDKMEKGMKVGQCPKEKTGKKWERAEEDED